MSLSKGFAFFGNLGFRGPVPVGFCLVCVERTLLSAAFAFVFDVAFDSALPTNPTSTKVVYAE